MDYSHQWLQPVPQDLSKKTAHKDDGRGGSKPRPGMSSRGAMGLGRTGKVQDQRAKAIC